MDREFFTEQATACTDLLYRVAYTILRNDQDCEDVVQEALLKAWLRRDSLREARYFRTWLTRILINACHDMLRKKRPTVSGDVLSNMGEYTMPDRELALALETLPKKWRLPLMLFYSEGMTYAEISRVLRIPVTTVQSRIRKGKAQLRKELKDE